MSLQETSERMRQYQTWKAARDRLWGGKARDEVAAPNPPPKPVAKPASIVVARSPAISPQYSQKISVTYGYRLRPPNAPPSPPTMTLISAKVSEEYGVSVLDMKSHRRTAKFVLPRQVVMYLSRHMTLLSYPTIARFMGGRDHTSVLWGVRKIEGLMAKDPEFAERVESLRAKIMEDLA